jgi:nucleoside permease NupC
MEYIFGVVGNTIALVLLWINRREHKWESFYKLFTGLALTDFLGVFLVYPFVTKRYVSHFTTTLDKIVHYPRHQQDVTLKTDSLLSIFQPIQVYTFFLRVWIGTSEDTPDLSIYLSHYRRYPS